MFLGDGDPVALPELADFVKAVLEQVRVQGLEFDAVVQQILNNAAAGLPVARQEGLEILTMRLSAKIKCSCTPSNRRAEKQINHE
jgi:hypothetical protein